MDKVLRILDANFNRAREGFRTVEDGIRFVLEDKFLTEKLKKIRHSFSTIFIKNFPSILLKKSRYVEKDIGKGFDKTGKFSYKEIIEKNLSRTSEALRSLEEFTKTINPKISKIFHDIRFNFYQIEKEIVIKLNKKKIPVPSFYAIINLEEKSDIFSFSEKVIKGKPDILQLRYKGENSEYFLKTALKIKEMLPKDIIFIINDRIDICILCDADGIHLGRKDIPVEMAKKIIPEKIIGTSCSNYSDIKKFSKIGVDYIAVGSIYPSPTKPEKKVIGVSFLTAIKKHINIPIIAIGGINTKNVKEVMEKGVDGIAVISTIKNSKNPIKTVSQFKKLVKKYGRK